MREAIEDWLYTYFPRFMTLHFLTSVDSEEVISLEDGASMPFDANVIEVRCFNLFGKSICHRYRHVGYATITESS